MWTSATFPRQKLHMGSWNPTIFAFWHIITRKDIAMQPLRQGSSTLPGHLGFFLMGRKIPLLPNVLQDCMEGSKEGKQGMACLTSNEAITRNHPTKKACTLEEREVFALLPWTEWSHPLASPFFPVLISSLLSALHKALPLPLFLFFPLSRSRLWFAITTYPRHIIPPTPHESWREIMLMRMNLSSWRLQRVQ